MRPGSGTVAKILATVFLCCYVSVGSSSAEVTVISSRPDGLSLSYHPDRFSADSLTVPGKTYVRFTCDGHAADGNSGTPALPIRTLIFAAPKGAVPTLGFTAPAHHLLSGVTVAPQSFLVNDESGIAREEYREDGVSYALSGYQPSAFAALGKSHAGNGVTLWEIVITPVLFDAHASMVSIADSLVITLSWNGQLTQSERSSHVPEYIINRDAVITFSAKPTLKTLGTQSNPFATGDWYKVAISDSGIYSISGSELAAAGFPVGATPINAVRLYYGGGKVLEPTPHSPTTDDFREVAMKVRDGNGNNYFDSADSLIFYAESLSRFILKSDSLSMTFQNHPYWTTNVYWLTVSESGTARRISTISTAPNATLPARTTCREIVHLEQENALEYDGSGIRWQWATLTKIMSSTYSFNAPGVVSGDSARVRIAFLNPQIYAHSLQFRINDKGPYSRYLAAAKSGQFKIPCVDLPREKDNSIVIGRTGGTSLDFNPYIQLDWIEIEYDRALKYSGNQMEVYFPGKGIPERVVLSGAPSSSLEIYDTTDPYEVVEHTGVSANETLSFYAELRAGAYSRFAICAPGSYRKVSSITRKNDSDLRNYLKGANYVLISPKIFIEQGKKLAEWRTRDSAVDPLTTKTVDLEDIFDEFAWGVYDPTAIRDYLCYLKENAEQDLRYCCLMGDATYKYKNISPNQPLKTWVPTYTSGDTTTDDFFVRFDTTRKPSIAIGRFCVNTVEEAKVTVAKAIDYEQNPERGPWRNRVLLIADDELAAGAGFPDKSFSNTIEYFDTGTCIPHSMERSKLMMIEYPLINYLKPAATEDFFNRLDEGAVLSMFFGHGNRDLIAHEHILVGTRDIERLNNGGRLSLFFFGSCEVGAFDPIDFTSLAEELHLRPGGGCIAVLAGSRKTSNTANESFCDQFCTALFNRTSNPEARVGGAVCAAKQVLANASDAQALIILFGDPAQRIAIPRYAFSTTLPDTLPRLKKIDIAGSLVDRGTPASLSGTLYVTARGPIQHKQYTCLNSDYTQYINYTQPGNLFYRGEIPVSGNSASLSLIVPKDVVSDTEESNIRFFADGGQKGASGIVEKLAIGDVDSSAQTDTAGPGISLSFDGKIFSAGDYIKHTPTLSAIITDPSGINVYGTRGHNVTATIDGSDIYIITDGVKCSSDFTTASVEYTFPQLSSGAHTLEVCAYDTYNNVTKLATEFNVVGSENGDVSIADLLNYPNPMRSDGTTFTFNLTDDAGSANIKIYSQSGRLVETVRFSAAYGFNTVFWKPSRELANGVYFYKLSIRSLNGRKCSKTEKLIVMR